MSNARADLGLGAFLIDLSTIEGRDKSMGPLYDLLTVDNDLTENEDYFREDTLEMGYDCEADRLHAELMEVVDVKKLDTIEKYMEVFVKAWEPITEQEYFGDVDYTYTEVGDNKYVISYAYGGDNQW